MSQRQFKIAKIILLSFGGGIIYVLPYLRFGFWDAMINNLNLTNTQLGEIGAIYGLFAIPSYFIGGVLADKFSPRKLLAISFLVTGLFGFYFASLPGYIALLIIHAIWGISTSLTFWCAFQALTRLSASPDHQARAFGIVTGGRSLLYVLISSFAIWVSTFYVDGETGLSVAITVISAIYCMIGLLFIIFWKEDKGSEVKNESKKFKLENLKEVLRMPEVWALSAMLFAVHYTLRLGDVFTPFASSTSGLAVTAAIAGVIGTIKQYGMAPFGGLIAALFADKVGRIRFSILAMVVTIGMAAGLLLTPTSATIFSVILLLGFMMFCWTAYMLVFSILDDARIPDQYSGTVIGIVSGLGFLSEPASNYTVGRILDAYAGLASFHMVFKLMIGGSIATIICYLVCARLIAAKKSGQPAPDLPARNNAL